MLPFTSDQAPVIDEVMPGLFVGAGHVFGNTAGPVTGRVLSQLIAGEAPDFDISARAATAARWIRSSSVSRPTGEAGPVSRVLVLGGAGEMGSAAVADLVERTDHEITVGDVRPDVAAALLERLGAPPRVVAVDVEDPRSLASALAGTDVVLNATYMRHNVPVTDAAIAAGVHLVDLGSYYPETLEQLDRHDAAVAAGCRIVPGCGVAPGLTNILARLGATQLDEVDAIRMYSYITHPMWTSPGIVVTRFDASTGTSVVLEDGALVERPSFTDEEAFDFPEPYGRQEVHLVPHPEPVTLPRSIAVRDVSFKVGYPADETTRIRVLLELGLRSTRAVHAGRHDDLAGPVRGGVHRTARDRPGGAERQRQARPSRGPPRRARRDADLRLRGRGGRAIGLVCHHRDGGGDRGRPGGARRSDRRQRRRRRPSTPREFVSALAARDLVIEERELAG